MTRPRSKTDDTLLDCLRRSATPMSAYELLDALRAHDVRSPPVVYRSLERLVKSGEIHRLEQLNAYFACHGHHHGAAAPVFAICTQCRRVEEWSVAEIDRSFAEAAERMGFAIADRTIELRGTCSQCRGLVAPQSGPACCAGHHDHD